MTGCEPLTGRYARHERLHTIGPEGQERLGRATAAVVGLGALGSVATSTLARAGVGRLILIDRDFVEPANLQGQILYDEQDAADGLPKAVAATRKVALIAGSVEVTPHVIDVTSENIRSLVEGAQVIVDGTDNFQTRFLINDLSVATGIPWVYTGALGHHGTVMTVLPGRTPCLRCYLPKPPPPASFGTCDTEGILAPLSQIMANLEAIEVIKILTGHEDHCLQGLVCVDGWNGEVDHVLLVKNPSCRACGLGQLDFLDGVFGPPASVLCGRDAVQLPGQPGVRLSFDELAPVLSQFGSVRYSEFILHLRTDRHEVSLFPDGRAIIKGTTDLSVARSLYSRIFGM